MTSTRPPSWTAAHASGRQPRRKPKLSVDPWQPNGWLREAERASDGRCVSILTIFLRGAECPFNCVFCDLWRQTLDGPTPRGAIPRQIAAAIAAAGPPTAKVVKLYNASNFFDPIAVPQEDDQEIAELLCPFDRVIVESHPRFIQGRCLEFADRLGGALEVAIGLETADADILARLDKRMTLNMVANAAATLRFARIGLRFFLLVPPPFVAAADAVASTQRSVTYAAGLGADHIALIPTRTESMRADIERRTLAPTLGMVEDALDVCHETPDVVVSVDLWNIERLAGCSRCAAERVDRLRAINLTGHHVARVPCRACAS